MEVSVAMSTSGGMRTNPRTGRPSEPTGFRFAVARLRWNMLFFFELEAARRDFTHSWADVHVEGARALGLPWPKVLGKATVAAEIGVVLLTPVLVLL